MTYREQYEKGRELEIDPIKYYIACEVSYWLYDNVYDMGTDDEEFDSAIEYVSEFVYDIYRNANSPLMTIPNIVRAVYYLHYEQEISLEDMDENDVARFIEKGE